MELKIFNINYSVIESELKEVLFNQNPDSESTIFFVRKINGLKTGETKWCDANMEHVEKLKKRVEDFYRKKPNNLITIEVKL